MSDENTRRAQRTTLTLLLIPVLVLGGVLGGLVLGVGSTPPGCDEDGTAVAVDLDSVPSGPIAGYGHTELVNAAHIMLAAQKLGGTVRDQRIGVMTSMGESSLKVIDYGDKAGPDSRGLFQQRANGAWGSYADRMDPFVSATNFFKVEMAIEGRATLEPTIVAHRVQRNANPYHYRPYWEPAGAIVQALAGVKPAGDGGTSAPNGGGSSGATKYNLGPVKPIATTVANTLGPRFGIKTIGGYRASNSRDPSGHPSGLALDFMINDIPNGTAVGNKLAAYITENYEQLGVKYLIWRQRIWTVQRADEGWRMMEDRGSVTQNHMDHVHLSLKADATVDPTAAPACEGVGGTPGKVSSTGWGRPSDGPLGSPYGWRMHPVHHVRRFHYGQDMGPGCNAPIWAVNKGTVVTAGVRGGFGHLIEVDHGGGVVSRYGHMYSSGVLVHVGDQVKAGQQIGKIGSDGVSTGCHLHFEVRINGSNIEPMDYLRKAGVNI